MMVHLGKKNTICHWAFILLILLELECVEWREGGGVGGGGRQGVGHYQKFREKVRMFCLKFMDFDFDVYIAYVLNQVLVIQEYIWFNLELVIMLHALLIEVL